MVPKSKGQIVLLNSKSAFRIAETFDCVSKLICYKLNYYYFSSHYNLPKSSSIIEWHHFPSSQSLELSFLQTSLTANTPILTHLYTKPLLILFLSQQFWYLFILSISSDLIIFCLQYYENFLTNLYNSNLPISNITKRIIISKQKSYHVTSLLETL